MLVSITDKALHPMITISSRTLELLVILVVIRLVDRIFSVITTKRLITLIINAIDYMAFHKTLNLQKGETQLPLHTFVALVLVHQIGETMFCLPTKMNSKQAKTRAYPRNSTISCSAY